jgi:hypothetical protein
MAKKFSYMIISNGLDKTKFYQIVRDVERGIKKQIPSVTKKEMDWAIDKGSEYNPKNLKEGIKFCVKLIKIRRYICK